MLEERSYYIKLYLILIPLLSYLIKLSAHSLIEITNDKKDNSNSIDDINNDLLLII